MAESKRFLLRLDPDLFEALRRWADEDLRSINAQIEFLLTDAARRAGRLPARGARGPQQREEPLVLPEDFDELAEVEEAAEVEEVSEEQSRKRGPRARTSA